jgi:hypothetical protein
LQILWRERLFAPVSNEKPNEHFQADLHGDCNMVMNRKIKLLSCLQSSFILEHTINLLFRQTSLIVGNDHFSRSFRRLIHSLDMPVQNKIQKRHSKQAGTHKIPFASIENVTLIFGTGFCFLRQKSKKQKKKKKKTQKTQNLLEGQAECHEAQTGQEDCCLERKNEQRREKTNLTFGQRTLPFKDTKQNLCLIVLCCGERLSDLGGKRGVTRNENAHLFALNKRENRMRSLFLFFKDHALPFRSRD